MRVLAGVAVGVTLSILAHILWKPAFVWALSQGDS